MNQYGNLRSSPALFTPYLDISPSPNLSEPPGERLCFCGYPGTAASCLMVRAEFERQFLELQLRRL